MAPEYAKAAKTLADSPAKLAKVDATVHNDLAKKFEIKGFPTLKFFKNGKHSDYNGGRTEGEIVAWLNKRTGPAAVTVNNEADLLKLQEAHSVFVLGAFSSVDSAAAKAFLAAASNDESHSYAITSDGAVLAKLGVSGDAVVVLKSFDDCALILPSLLIPPRMKFLLLLWLIPLLLFRSLVKSLPRRSSVPR